MSTPNTDQSIYTDKFQILYNFFEEINTDGKKELYHHNISDRSFDDNYSQKVFLELLFYSIHANRVSTSNHACIYFENVTEISGIKNR